MHISFWSARWLPLDVGSSVYACFVLAHSHATWPSNSRSKMMVSSRSLAASARLHGCGQMCRQMNCRRVQQGVLCYRVLRHGNLAEGKCAP